MTKTYCNWCGNEIPERQATSLHLAAVDERGYEAGGSGRHRRFAQLFLDDICPDCVRKAGLSDVERHIAEYFDGLLAQLKAKAMAT